ncbi:MAG: glycosyltransferase family 2 protein [Clostridia bacterium]|nr:glycosyltransferase family 2 protein [Clostridia bacterium]
MKSVAILLSTYNGERFLREQLDSILAQKEVEVKLFVRDDGSSDGTKEILSEYAEKHSNIHLDFAENVGVGNSFMNLLYSVPDEFDYYAFADQDDIWEENKIAEAARLLEEKGAILYASNQECVDKEGNSLGLRYKPDENIHLTPESILQENMLAGCTMVITNGFYKILTEEARRPLPELLHNRIHDVWLAATASLYEGIVYDERSFIKYRQHENNVVGASKAGFGKRLKAKLKKLTHREKRNGRSWLARELCACFPEVVEKYPLITFSAKANKYKYKRKLIKNKKLLCSYSGESGFGFYLKVLFGLY